ncbi:MAG: hypothetical protein JWQ58_3816 [Reyranella sp.]|nr:hypothetical protein [Reyranella sp.]
MPISSFGPHRGETSWAATQTPRTKQRIVRLGRPANDNFRPAGVRTWMLVTAAGLTGAVLALIISNWRFF